MADTSWHTDAYPELRPGPPWVMEEMVAAQPALAQAMLDDPPPAAAEIAAELADALRDGRPVTVTGCGTSEHGAQAISTLLASAAAPGQRALIRARPGLTAAMDPAGGVCLAVSHEGGTHATLLALQAARRAGARTAVITHDGASSIATAADHAYVTPLHDLSWCHTVAYSSALIAGAILAAGLGAPSLAPQATAALLSDALAVDATPLAPRLADRRVVLCAGAGRDHVTARELALKLAEGARLPTVALELETVLHGQLAGHESADGLVISALDDGPEPDRLARRLAHVAAAAAEIGMPVAALLSAHQDHELAPELTPAGRLVAPPTPEPLANPAPAALLTGAAMLQTLTIALAHARDLNPDLIRREQEPYRRAAAVAEDGPDW
jgi:fructoselysine-6-P-deglycase FrlB-like protein